MIILTFSSSLKIILFAKINVKAHCNALENFHVSVLSCYFGAFIVKIVEMQFKNNGMTKICTKTH